MKKLLSIFALICILLSLSSCGSQESHNSPIDDTDYNQEIEHSTDENEPENDKEEVVSVYNDDEFIQDAQRAAEVRWSAANSVSDEQLNAMSVAEYQKTMKSFVQKEVDEFKDPSYYSFENAEVEKLANYIFKGIDLQLEGAQYIGVDDANAVTKSDATWVLGTYYRYYAYYNLYMDGKLSFDSQYKDAVDAMTGLYATAKEKVELQEYVNYISQTIELKEDEENSTDYYKQYTSVIENTTEYTISSLAVEINFLDSDGVIIENASDYIQNFKSGDKVRINISFDASKGEFSSYDVSISCYI